LPLLVWPEEKTMKTLLRPAVSLFVLLTAITGIVYPLAITGIAKVAFPEAADGSLIVKDGKAIGSRLIGQNFTDTKYFWGRPSATGPMPYNGAASGGSNQGPLNPALIDAVKGRIESLKAADPDNQQPIPADLVTASASGLDPHISPAAADYQIERVAKVRKLPLETVKALVDQNTEDRQWGVFGEPRVNVLKLNIALDDLG
jgi:potassium-transporting ATPase KdpC subunit